MPASRPIALLSVLALLTLVSSASAQTIRTVRAAGPGAAPPWDAAVTTLQATLAVAQAGDEVWIAEGTYSPATTAGFVVPSNVRIFGGFAGTETARSHRGDDPLSHLVTLTRGGSGCFHVLNFYNTGPLTSVDRVKLTSGQNLFLFTPTPILNASGPCLFATNASITCTD